MKLESFRKLENKNQKTEITGFLQELSNYIKKAHQKPIERQEGLYYVLNANPKQIYLTKFGDKKVFEAKVLPENIRQVVSEGFILRYKDGKYEIDEELTDKNFEGELDIDNYRE